MASTETKKNFQWKCLSPSTNLATNLAPSIATRGCSSDFESDIDNIHWQRCGLSPNLSNRCENSVSVLF